MFPSDLTDDRQALISIEKRALDAQNAGDVFAASKEWERLLALDPEWEHGIAHYSLAGCYEDLGRLAEAEQLYLKALDMEPSPAHLGGYTGFLYLHGDPAKALDAYLQLLQFGTNPNWTLRLLPAIQTLATRLGIDKEEIKRRVSDAEQRGLQGEPPELVRLWRERHGR